MGERGGVGFSRKIYCKSSVNGELEPHCKLPAGWVEMTSAMAADDSTILIGRGNCIYNLSYSSKVIRRLLETPASVVTLCGKCPVGVAGLSNGQIICFGVDDMKLLASTYTWTYTAPVSVSVDWLLYAVVVVEKGGSVEVLLMPSQVARHSVPTFELSEAAVVRRLVAVEEDSKRRSGQHEEAAILGQYTVPVSTERYLSKNTLVL